MSFNDLPSRIPQDDGPFFRWFDWLGLLLIGTLAAIMFFSSGCQSTGIFRAPQSPEFKEFYDTVKQVSPGMSAQDFLDLWNDYLAKANEQANEATRAAEERAFYRKAAWWCILPGIAGIAASFLPFVPNSVRSAGAVMLALGLAIALGANIFMRYADWIFYIGLGCVGIYAVTWLGDYWWNYRRIRCAKWKEFNNSTTSLERRKTLTAEINELDALYTSATWFSRRRLA